MRDVISPTEVPTGDRRYYATTDGGGQYEVLGTSPAGVLF